MQIGMRGARLHEARDPTESGTIRDSHEVRTGYTAWMPAATWYALALDNLFAGLLALASPDLLTVHVQHGWRFDLRAISNPMDAGGDGVRFAFFSGPPLHIVRRTLVQRLDWFGH